MRQAYDLVLVDAGVLDSDAAATQLATLLGAGPIDDGLVVRDVARTPITQVEEVGHRLARLGIERWDLADNFG